MFFGKLKGAGSAASVPMPSWKNVALAWLGGVLAIAAIAQVGDGLSLPLILGSFGASCVLIDPTPELTHWASPIPRRT